MSENGILDYKGTGGVWQWVRFFLVMRNGRKIFLRHDAKPVRRVFSKFELRFWRRSEINGHLMDTGQIWHFFLHGILTNFLWHPISGRQKMRFAKFGICPSTWSRNKLTNSHLVILFPTVTTRMGPISVKAATFKRYFSQVWLFLLVIVPSYSQSKITTSGKNLNWRTFWNFSQLWRKVGYCPWCSDIASYWHFRHQQIWFLISPPYWARWPQNDRTWLE